MCDVAVDCGRWSFALIHVLLAYPVSTTHSASIHEQPPEQRLGKLRRSSSVRHARNRTLCDPITSFTMPSVHALDNRSLKKYEHEHRSEQMADRAGQSGDRAQLTLVEIFRAAYKEVGGAGELFPGPTTPIGYRQVVCRGAFCFVHPGHPLGPLPPVTDRRPASRLARYLQHTSSAPAMLPRHAPRRMP